MVIANFSQSTRTSYKGAIKRLCHYYKTFPNTLDKEQLIDYVAHLKTEHNLSRHTMRISVAAIKYVFKYVYDKSDFSLNVSYPKKEVYLPVILTGQEVKRLFDLTENLKHRLIFKLIYSAGLRRSELLHLRLTDFDWKNHQLTIRQGKGKKDRYTILARSILSDYQFYLAGCQPKDYLFYGRQEDGLLSAGALRWALNQAKERAGIKKAINLHSLRHSFASHLLSVGVDIVTIQQLPGHEDLRTTMVYLHLNHKRDNKPKSPLDFLYK